MGACLSLMVPDWTRRRGVIAGGRWRRSFFIDEEVYGWAPSRGHSNDVRVPLETETALSRITFAEPA